MRLSAMRLGLPFWVASVLEVRQNSGRAPRPKLGERNEQSIQFAGQGLRAEFG